MAASTAGTDLTSRTAACPAPWDSSRARPVSVSRSRDSATVSAIARTERTNRPAVAARAGLQKYDAGRSIRLCRLELTKDLMIAISYVHRNGRCVRKTAYCDGFDSCGDNSDEEHCSTTLGESMAAKSTNVSGNPIAQRQTRNLVNQGLYNISYFISFIVIK